MENTTVSTPLFDLDNYTLEGELLKIYTYPDKILSQVATPVESFDRELEVLVKNMIYTMYKSPGIGLAAPQVGVGKRLFVMDVDYDREEVTAADGSKKWEYDNLKPMVLINPEFVDKKGKTTYQEGCLSLPGVYEDVVRSEEVKVKYQDIHGNTHEMDADGLLAICLQHENDHLDGKVFIERLSALKLNFYKKKLLKQKKS